MILTAARISEEIEAGAIVVSPFRPGQLNGSSYSFRLGEELFEPASDAHLPDQHAERVLPIKDEGVRLEPGRLYLGTTQETIGSRSYVVLLGGSREAARLGIFVQLSANLGNLGDAHRWTLELTCVQPVTIYPKMLIGRVIFCVPQGDIEFYSGEYTKHSRPMGNLHQSLLRGSRS